MEKYDELSLVSLDLNTAEFFIIPQNNYRVKQIIDELEIDFDTSYEKAIDEEDYDVIHLRWRR